MVKPVIFTFEINTSKEVPSLRCLEDRDCWLISPAYLFDFQVYLYFDGTIDTHPLSN